MTPTSSSSFTNSSTNLGLVWTIVIVSLWIGTLITFLGLDLGELSIFQWIAIVLVRTFLHTGLFIMAHDAMHESLIPNQPELNHTLGKFVLGLYALLPYDNVNQNHHKHHQSPGRVGDPDFHDGLHSHPIVWYVQFLGSYFSMTQMMVFITIMGTIGAELIIKLHIPIENCILVWMIPLILSSMQLFCFGTYFPHHNESLGPQSSYYPWLLSFLICYHFSHHQEHHQYPEVPWYQLPEISKKSLI